ncbi:MAG: nitrile hydratase subunit alpha [Proteobacteria bacterium]|nr:nitrile hydratase subunit alpha [Pseudomonadota bacterium]
MVQLLDARMKAKVVNKALQDEDFSRALFGDPKKTLKDTFGIDISERTVIHVLRQTRDHSDFIIPLRPEEITENMSENQIIERLTRDMPRISDKLADIIDISTRILAKAWTSREFLDRFEKDPKAVINTEKNGCIPENVEMVARIEDENTLYIAIPEFGSDSELTDDELGMVSGGISPPDLVQVCMFIIFSAIAAGW